MWYATRALGSVMATVFFMMISSGVTPYVVQAEAPVMREPLPLNPAYGPKVSVGVSKKLGTLPSPVPARLGGRSGPAAINDLYLLRYGESISEVGKNDHFKVLYMVDSSGTANLESVIEHPSDQNLLNEFNQLIASARVRPASANGRAVPSSIVFTFSKIFVVSD
jgi:hypothetical protein